MFSEGALRADSFKGKFYLKPCSDGAVGLSQVFNSWDYSENRTYDFSQGHYQLPATLDESIEFEMKSYFERYVAYQVELARFQVTTAGYPAMVVDEVLEEIVVSALSKPNYPVGAWESDTISYDTLLAELQLYWLNHPNIPEPQLGEGCGGGGMKAIIRPEPPDGRVWLISEFDYRLCELHGYDPRDMENCRWREETGHLFTVVGGNYRLFAEWKDGRTVHGRRNLYSDSEIDTGEFFLSASGEKVWADLVVYVRP